MRRNPFYKGAFLWLLNVALLQGVPLATAAGQKDFKYTPKEYDAFTKAVNQSNPAEKTNAIVACLKTYPKSALTDYAVSNYLVVMQQYRDQGKAGEVATAGKKILAHQPDNLDALLMTSEASFQTGQYSDAVRYGEKAYAKKAHPPLADMLARAYLQLKNEKKVIFYGEKACAKLKPQDCYQVLGELTRIFAEKKQWSKAAPYAEKTIAGFDAAQKPAQTSQTEWNKYVTRRKALSYMVLGRYAAEKGRWSTARSNYQKAIRIYPNPPYKGEAYYYSGIGHWKGDRIDPAMKAFAMGSVQKGAPHARECRKQLEKLYKSTHNDSLAGIDEFVQRATGR